VDFPVAIEAVVKAGDVMLIMGAGSIGTLAVTLASRALGGRA
jgi:threonine dehydrogenase-like Zn-dependent dehydrogenase